VFPVGRAHCHQAYVIANLFFQALQRPNRHVRHVARRAHPDLQRAEVITRVAAARTSLASLVISTCTFSLPESAGGGGGVFAGAVVAAVVSAGQPRLE